MSLTPRERAIVALEGKQPDFVPTFELAFHETERDFDGRAFFGMAKGPGLDAVPYEQAIVNNARLHVDIARRFEHSIVCLTGAKPQLFRDYEQGMSDLVRAVKEIAGDEFLVMCHGDATYAIPTGTDMMEFSLRIVQDFDGMKVEAERKVRDKLAQCKKLLAAGMDGFILCDDYAFNSGPFLSPDMFGQLVAPYLKMLVAGQREMGAWVIKHTDGNIMPVIDMIVDAEPHALHSIDPMAGMDIKVVKERYGDRVAICGNVQCDYMQTGTPEQIRESCEYCLKWAKPGGGYLFTTSNTVFRGMPLASYDIMQEVWRARRDY